MRIKNSIIIILFLSLFLTWCWLNVSEKWVNLKSGSSAIKVSENWVDMNIWESWLNVWEKWVNLKNGDDTMEVSENWVNIN